MCAYHDIDEYACWASRYNMGIANRYDIEADGGPCQCLCHNDCDEDEFWSEDGLGTAMSDLSVI